VVAIHAPCGPAASTPWKDQRGSRSQPATRSGAGPTPSRMPPTVQPRRVWTGQPNRPAAEDRPNRPAHGQIGERRGGGDLAVRGSRRRSRPPPPPADPPARPTDPSACRRSAPPAPGGRSAGDGRGPPAATCPPPAAPRPRPHRPPRRPPGRAVPPARPPPARTRQECHPFPPWPWSPGTRRRRPPPSSGPADDRPRSEQPASPPRRQRAASCALIRSRRLPGIRTTLLLILCVAPRRRCPCPTGAHRSAWSSSSSDDPPTKPAQPARACVVLAFGPRAAACPWCGAGSATVWEPTWKTIGWKTVGSAIRPIASGCGSTSSISPARSPRHAWTGWRRRRAYRKGRRCPRERATGRSPRGVPVGAGAGRLVDPPTRRGRLAPAVRAGRVAARRRSRRSRPDPGRHDRLAAGAPALGRRRKLGVDLRRAASAARGAG
jgi:hypothetical protein